MPRDTLSILDNRTGKSYELSVEEGTVRAMELRQIKTSTEDFGLMSYDPGFTNTACCRSQITYIDGEKGILRYRGYPIEELAEKSSFLEVAYLILSGELPGEPALKKWRGEVMSQTRVPQPVLDLVGTFPSSSYPMGMLMSAVASLSSYYPDALNLEESSRATATRRLLGHMPTLAAAVYRRIREQPVVDPRPDLGYTGNFLHMVFSRGEEYTPEPVVARALDVLFLLHADHEQNCSTSTMRNVGSSQSDPYSAAAAAIGALSGPLHGGANAAVLGMLEGIGSAAQVPALLERVRRGELRLMGFGHRVYKNYDPRARIIKSLAHQVFEITGGNPLLDVARELERAALEDEYFIRRKLYPNVDFYSGLIYQALGFPTSFFPVLFALGRTVGWLAQWEESRRDPEQKIARPRQIYDGAGERHMD